MNFDVQLITNLQLAKRLVDAIQRTKPYDLKIKSCDKYNLFSNLMYIISELHIYLHIRLRKIFLKACFINWIVGKWEGMKPNFHFNENTHPITPSK